jgi:phosphoribosylglycinamide formyltransferase-1
MVQPVLQKEACDLKRAGKKEPIMEKEKKQNEIPKSTTGTERINLALVASGSGTDADSVMAAWEIGCVPEINPPLLISTKKGVGCLEKSMSRGLRSEVVDYKEYPDPDSFNSVLKGILKSAFTDLVFLVGCIHKVYPVEGMTMYNIHPADPAGHGGDKMYGLAVHQHVLEEVKDLIHRGKKNIVNNFYTYPTVHEATLDYDGGDMLLRQAVLIPDTLVKNYCQGLMEPKQAAKALQEVVLPYEWLMLPAAVRMSARRILEKRRTRG